jgi:hypothetical protein
VNDGIASLILLLSDAGASLHNTLFEGSEGQSERCLLYVCCNTRRSNTADQRSTAIPVFDRHRRKRKRMESEGGVGRLRKEEWCRTTV